MADSSALIASKTSVDLKASPSNYGINHLYWDRPSDTLSWTSLRLMMKLGGYPTSETDGTNIFECTSNSLFLVPSSVGTGGGFNQGTTSGGGAVVLGSNAGTGPILTIGSQSGNGGGVTLGTGATTGSVLTFTPSRAVSALFPYDRTLTPYRTYSAGSNPVGSNDGYTSATFRLKQTGTNGSGYTITVASVGNGYTVGDVLTFSSFQLPDGSTSGNLTVTIDSITPIQTGITETYVVYPTGGTGSGAKVQVTRSGSAGQLCYVTNVVLLDGGAGYTANDVLTIPASGIGGSANGAASLTVTVKTIAGSSASTAVTKYENVAQTSVTPSGGKGALFDIYRAGIPGSPVAITNVVTKFKGYGYATNSAITISAADIGGSANGASNLIVTGNGTVDSSIAGVINAFSYGSSINSLSGWSGITVATGGTVVSGASTTYTDVPIYNATGSGTGARATVVRDSSGNVSSVTLTSRGYNYAVNDLLVIPSSYIGGYPTKQTQLGETTDYHVFDNGTEPTSPTNSPVITNPGRGVVGSFHNGKEVYYSLFASYTSYSGSAGTTSWFNIANASALSVEDTGARSWIVDHLPKMYFNSFDNSAGTIFYGGTGSSPDDSDLNDFLSLLAFHVDMYKTYATHVFKMTNPHFTDEKLLKKFLKQFNVDFADIQNLSQARAVMLHALKVFSEKGSIAGVKDLIDLYTSASATSSITLGTNILHGFNTSSFEQSTGQWRPWTSATFTSGTTVIGYSNSAPYSSALTQSPPSSYLLPFDLGDGTNATTGYGKITNSSTTAEVLGFGISPKITNAAATSSAASTTIVVKPNIAEVGDYVIGTDPSIITPGTKVTAVSTTATTSGTTITLSNALTGTVTSGDEVWFSRTGTDKVGASTAFQAVEPGSPYSFNFYTREGSGTTKVPVIAGIRWHDTSGTVIGTAVTNTLATASQTATATTGTAGWNRIDVAGIAPVSTNVTDRIVYAEPYIQVGTTGTALASSGTYYVDAASLNPGIAVTNKARTSSTVTLTTATTHGFTVGSKVAVKGVDSATTTIFDGVFTITGVNATNKTFTYTASSSGPISSTTCAGLAASMQPYEDARKVTITTTGLDSSAKARMKNALGGAITLAQGPIGTPSTSGTLVAGASGAVASVKQYGSGYNIVSYSAEGAAVTGKALASNVATLTVVNNPFIKQGDYINVVGVDATFNTTHTQVTAATDNTISYAVTHANVTATTSAGTVSTFSRKVALDRYHSLKIGDVITVVNPGNTYFGTTSAVIYAVSTNDNSISYANTVATSGLALNEGLAYATAGIVTENSKSRYEVLYTTSTAHNAVLGSQVAIVGFTGNTDVNLNTTATYPVEIVAIPSPTQFIVNVPSGTGASSTAAVTNTSGSLAKYYIDLGRSGVNILV